MLRRGIPEGDFLVVDQLNVGIPSELSKFNGICYMLLMNFPNYIFIIKVQSEISKYSESRLM
jgi:hypothetical protein